MILKISLAISVLLQLIAAFYAVGLIRKSNYNISWIMLTIAFIFMAIRRITEFSMIMKTKIDIHDALVNNLISVVTSIFIFAGIYFFRYFFKLQEELEQLKNKNESQILSAVLRAEENERNKIAKELHDGLAPLLSSAKMLLSAVDKKDIDNNNMEIIEKTDDVMLSSIDTLKEISNHISPHILRNFGISKAIEKYIQNLNIKEKINIKFDTNIDSTRYENDIETVIYRINCELLTNSFKHAQCDTISINLFRYKNQLVFIYRDNGIGIDQKKLHKSEGMGLSNIFSRVKSVNGQVKFNTRPINGFWIKIKIPVE